MTRKEKQKMCLRCPHSKYYSGMQTERMHCEIEDKYIVFDCHDDWKICATLHTVGPLIVADMM